MPNIDREAYLHLLNKTKPVNNKYHNQPVIINGIRFQSKKEGLRYQDLKSAEKAGAIIKFTLQPRFDFPMKFFYKADFKYWDVKKNKWIIEDTKGFKDKVFILKEKCFRYFYPDLELRVIS